MRQVIDTAPRDGKVVILEDDASGTYDVAQWSIEAGNWIGENGEPSKITPTHGYAMPGDKYALPEDSQVGPLASRRRGYNFFHPFNFFSSDRSAPRQSAAASDAIEHRPVANAVSMNAVVEAQTSPVIAMHTPHTRGRFAASSITVIIIVAALVGMYLLRARFRLFVELQNFGFEPACAEGSFNFHFVGCHDFFNVFNRHSTRRYGCHAKGRALRQNKLVFGVRLA